MAALQQDRLDEAADILERAVAAGQVSAATMFVRQKESTDARHFGKAATNDAMFLLGSISKPIAVMGLLTLFDREAFKLDDPLKKFIPTFTGDGRDAVTMKHLLTHVSGLPDQLPKNNALRAKHAPLAEFVDHAIRTPLHFNPGKQYQYSSMAILLAAHVAELISGSEIRAFVDQTVLQPLNMTRSAQGLGRFKLEDMVACQTEIAAPESGGGDPNAKNWDWNSLYWRNLGAPWGGTHASAEDVAKFLTELLDERGIVLKPETALRMTTNQNAAGVKPRGLGLAVGSESGSPGCSDKTFGHTGSTGTICWADPATQSICVVLTSLPANAADPHPRNLAAAKIAVAIR